MPKVDEARERLYGPLAEGFGQRIDAAVQSLGGRSKAASAMGISKDQIGKIIAERAVPNFAAIAALARQSGLSLKWLAFAEAPEHTFSTGKSFSEDEDEVVRIKGIDNDRSYSFPRKLVGLNHNASAADCLAVMTMPGDAMEPTIKADGVLILDTSANRIVDGAVFVFDFGGERVVRRTQRQPQGVLVLSADNIKYAALKLDASEAPKAIVLGRVIWSGGPL